MFVSAAPRSEVVVFNSTEKLIQSLMEKYLDDADVTPRATCVSTDGQICDFDITDLYVEDDDLVWYIH